MGGVIIECANAVKTIKDCELSKEVQESFHYILKQGIYKELHKRNLLSDVQLNSLLKNK